MSSSSSLPPSSPSLRMCKYSSVCLTSIPFFYRQALWCGSVSEYFVANLEMLHTINTVMEEYRFEWNLLSASANTMFSSFLEYNLNPRHRYLFSLPTEFLPHYQAMIIRVFFMIQQRHHAVVYEEQGWCSPKFMQFLIVTLVFFMVVR